MRLLYLGDVVGRSGRDAVVAELPGLRARLRLDFVAVNAENAAGGFGCTGKIAEDILAAGADAVTLGDHAFDQKDMLQALDREPRILRPLNIARAAPGAGFRIFPAPRGRKVAVAVALGRVFMSKPYDDPFSALDAALKAAPLGAGVDAAIVEIHAEATSEKMATGWWLDGRASLVVGAHTHVPTSDAMILPKGTAYQTDAGMCGDYLSVIGMDRKEPLRRFVTGMTGDRFEPASGPATLSGVFVETDDATGRARSVAPLRLGGALAPSLPDL
ncbi:TIGR00282 family metallophosphoesterase [Rubrimonas sp.]|uniref:TIGR00282 family metallophosphoesterase n=1 Tax=Rubrimonas sp. TaxID=2036015 RepID=UPI002FDCB080